VAQQVGDECAGHNDSLLLVGDNGGEIAGGLRRSWWERHRGAVAEGVLRRDQVHGLALVVEAVERGGQHQVTVRSGFRRPGCGSLHQRGDEVEFESALEQPLGAVGVGWSLWRLIGSAA
jgi:hypothetical protein